MKGPMLNGKPFHVAFPYGGEQSEGDWGTWLAGSKDRVGVGQPSLAYGFSSRVHALFREGRPDMGSFAHEPGDARQRDEVGADDPVADQPGPVGLSARSGGKLLMYHGWSDAALSPLMSTTLCRQRLCARCDGAQRRAHVHAAGCRPLRGRAGARPGGLSRCARQMGDVTKAAPDELTANFACGAARASCAPIPRKQTYTGTGDGKSPEHFVCKAP